jgi:membrane fusion protein, multidrug efflux system
MRSKSIYFALLSLCLLLSNQRVFAAEALDTAAKFRGVVRTLRQATISSEFSARAKRVNVKEGQAVKENELLIEFDCRRQQAELEGLLADQREMKVTLDSNTYLAKRQAVSTQDVEVAAARVAKADASVAALRVQLEQCEVYAPFAGQIAALPIHEHELSAPGRPLLTIIGNSDLEVALIIPSSMVMIMKEGTKLAFTLDETGQTIAVRIARAAAAIDTVSQTAMVSAAFEGAMSNVLTGMSGTARLPSNGE